MKTTPGTAPPESFRIVVQAGRDTPALPALRRLIKRLGRAYRLRVVTIDRIEQEPRA